MWRMKLMCLTVAYFLIAQLIFQNSIYGQKKWDGGGRDSLWNNPNNWHPDGVPSSGDTVVLDNHWALSDYRVLFPDSTITSNAYSIRIQPSPLHQISLVIPSTNTAVPALSLGATDTAIYIGDGGSLYNNSGASAGNAIVITGKFKIANGGRYVHQTLRGNALLISNLITAPETRKGIFEFNVPGNSAYTISASGRTFGSLVLKGPNTTRKTYTSSGANKLNIEGDFIINEQAGFSSSLTNTISIGGDLLVKGRLYVNPVSADTAGRNLEMKGMHQTIAITGLFNQGIHFRKWMINGSYAIVNSSINIEQPTAILHFLTDSYVDIGNSIIKGLGKVILDSNTHFATSARTIIGADSMSNIQTALLDLHHKIGFTCYGNNIQFSGERFPSTISSLRLEKSHENIILTNSLQISDSLLLRKGIILASNDAAITIGNYTEQGNDSSYVAASILHSSKKSELIFPIGTDTLFAPARIIRNADSEIAYTMKVSRFLSSDSLQQTLPPVEKITSKIYWTISQSDTTQSDEEVRLELMNNQIENLSCVVTLDTADNKWKLTQNSSPYSNNIVLSAKIAPIVNSLYTIGRLQQQALPLNNIFLKKVSSRNQIILYWIVNDDENAKYYLIEQSKDGRTFYLKDSLISLNYKGEFGYKKHLQRDNKATNLYRVNAVDIDGNKYYSNIVHDQYSPSTITIYPNPSTNQLHIKTSEKVLDMKLIYPNGKMNLIKYIPEDFGYMISTGHLPIGNYFLLIESTNGLETFAFMKQ